MEGTKKPAKTDLKPDLFAGTSSEDASYWLDLFERPKLTIGPASYNSKPFLFI